MNIKNSKKNIFFKNDRRKDKLKVLSNFDIIEMMDDRINKKSEFLGVYSKDNLPKKIKINQSVVMNLDNDDGNGTHWVAIYNGDDSDYIEFFDSYGLPPADLAIKFMKTSNKKIAYNTSQIQTMNSIMCGYYAMFFINQREKGKTMYDIIYSFDNIIGNSTLLKQEPLLLLKYFNLVK
jgi:hypothetical protein